MYYLKSQPDQGEEGELLQDYFSIFILALVFSWLFTPIYKRVAWKLGMVDKPNPRRLNKVPIPNGGGLAIMGAFWLAVVLKGVYHPSLKGLAVGSVIIGLTGVIDDRWELNPGLKFIGQLLAAVAVVAGGTVIQFATNPFGGMVYLGWWGIPITVAWITAVANMFNFIDGIDGLAAGVAVIACLPLFAVALQLGYTFVAVLLLALAGSALGFLRYNFSPAKLFLGDTGAMFLGFMLGSLAVEGTLKGAATVAFAIPILILGLPVIEIVCSVVRRTRNGVPVYQADQGHLHHRLLEMGLSQKQAVLLLYGWALVFGFLGVRLAAAPPALAIGLTAACLGIVFHLAGRLGWTGQNEDCRRQESHYL